MRQYIDATGQDEMLHRTVVCAVNGLVEYLQSERKRVPNEVLLEAERLPAGQITDQEAHRRRSALRHSHSFYDWKEVDLLSGLRLGQVRVQLAMSYGLDVVGFTSRPADGATSSSRSLFRTATEHPLSAIFDLSS